MTTQSAHHAPERLPDRYLREFGRRLPDDQRADIAAELGTSIADRVESLRLAQPGTSLEAAEYAALVELGDPVRLAAGYSGRAAQLIGPKIYPDYVRVLRSVLLVAVPVSVGGASLMSIAEDSPDGLIGRLIWLVLTVVVHSTFWVTVVFATVERAAKADPQGSLASWTPEHLPNGSGESRRPITDLARNVAWFTLFCVAIGSQQLFPSVRDDGERLPLLEPDLWSFWLPLVLVMAVVSIVFEVVRYHAGGWSRRLAVTNSVVGALFAAPLVYLAATDRLLNARVLEVIGDGAAAENGFSWSLMFFVPLLWVWSSADGWRQARSGQSRSTSAG